MSTHRTLIATAAIATLALAACGGGDSGTDAATATADATGTTAPATTATTAAPATTAPATTDAPATTAATTTPPATTAPADAGGDLANCMQGTWRADAAEHQRRIDDMGMPTLFSVDPSTVSDVVISGDTFVADSTIVLLAAIGDTTMRAGATSHIEGTFTLDGNLVTTTTTVFEVEDDAISIVMADGTEVPLPEGGIPFEAPTASSDFNGSTVACDGTTMSFDVLGTEFGSITYTRVG